MYKISGKNHWKILSRKDIRKNVGWKHYSSTLKTYFNKLRYVYIYSHNNKYIRRNKYTLQ